MALRVVPAGDERCDIHNARRPPKYVCKDCLKEYGVQPGRPLTLRRGALLGAGVSVAIAAVIAVLLIAGGGGGNSQSGPPTQEDVVNALGLSPNPDGSGWITLDGACAVLSIQVGSAPKPRVNAAVEATNEAGTVRAVVQNAFSQNQAACVDRIDTALRAHF